ncbi:sugar ABC transporter ATP-binding protein [Phytohabitans sp. ZYX-F-186]|uniref:Sugar ABC transporter ATP-binding protein n=1 Tax=Phytohabitans maris TaxID=3071409 RepID=A0ABU0ZW16_9ACTN|nr:sugar ABC transporter ATP-binding protein [Phytohabitans sp. ZYX-F-186]MDQ7911224.1 sugar ABC transporter ATP-binding protein [Phytohabitans sp. ZYX-F-186]
MDLPLLRLRDVSKTFAGTTVLSTVDLDLRAGEVHGLVGENGSGKSTLIKILAGFHEPDPGADVQVAGGLSFVHQDLALEASLTVAENFTVDRLGGGSGWWIDLRAEARQVRATLAGYGLDLDPRAPVAALNQVERAMLAIVRAVERTRGERGVLVLDEPTVFLPHRDRGTLFDLIRRLTAAGNGVLFVSHDLEECLDVCDRISVLRDGHLQGTVDSAGTTRADLVRLMIGKHLAGTDHRPAAATTRREPVVTVTDLAGTTVDGVSFTVAPGEILGVTGLLGSGFDELPYLLGGAGRKASGHLTVAGRRYPVARFAPFDAVEAGIALVPGDRARDGAALSMSVQDNISLRVLHRYRSRLGLRWGRLRADSATLLDEYDVRPRRLTARYGTLSGGNQQKVMLAKWLQTRPKVLVLHEPTQGVDVGAREQIYGIVRRGAADGAAVVCASADQEQLAQICHRVLIIRAGRIVAELTGDRVSKANIARETLEANHG